MSSRRSISFIGRAAALALGLTALAVSSAVAATPSSLTIRESFQALPCPHKARTTVEMEGCYEHQVLAKDRTIDALNGRIYAKLSAAGRREFIVSNADWVKYRNQACVSAASVYSGGSAHPVAYADCLSFMDGSHVSELKTLLAAIQAG